VRLIIRLRMLRSDGGDPAGVYVEKLATLLLLVTTGLAFCIGAAEKVASRISFSVVQ